MKFRIAYFLLFTFLLSSCAHSIKAIFTEDHSEFANPERGFYIPLSTKASNFTPLDVDKLREYLTTPHAPGRASYQVLASLIYRGYELDSFLEKPLSEDFLEKLEKDFSIIRLAGLKMILRFSYTNESHSGNCPDENKICPPYGDATKEVVFNHVEQLKPLLQKNADVIAVLQEGFIGIWGENYYTDHWGDASQNGVGKMTDSGWIKRNELLRRLLQALPESRMIQVRTPQIKQKLLFGPSADVNSSSLDEKEAYSGSDGARLGFHNDCFLSSADDYGTFYDYGSSSQPRSPALEVLRNYISQDTKYTAVGGETCDDAFSPQNDCEPLGHAETEMRKMHYSYLNAAYNNAVNNDWDSLGCMQSIKEKLGYRFVLEKASTKWIKKRKNLRVKIDLRNDGYASPYNARPVELVLRNKSTKEITIFPFDTQIQKWFSGKVHLEQGFSVGNQITSGDYELLLNLPDASNTLRENPAYSVRFANKDCWEVTTGYNNLKLDIKL